MHLHQFAGRDGDILRFTAVVDARLQTHALHMYDIAGKHVLSSAGFLELVCSASRIFSRDPVACNAAILHSVILCSDTITYFSTSVNVLNGDTAVKRSYLDSVSCMTCRACKSQSTPASLTANTVRNLFIPSRMRSMRCVKARVGTLAEHGHFEYHVNPCQLESVLSMRAVAAVSDLHIGVLYACQRYSTVGAMSSRTCTDDATAYDDWHSFVVTNISGAEFKHIGQRHPAPSTQTRAQLTAQSAPPPHILRTMTASLSSDEVRRKVISKCAKIVGNPNMRGDEQFTDLGMDSLAAAELRATIQHEFGVVLPIEAAFECPTANALAAYILQETLKQTTAHAHAARTKAALSRVRIAYASARARHRLLKYAFAVFVFVTYVYFLFREIRQFVFYK